jgi:hypothetical protein
LPDRPIFQAVHGLEPVVSPRAERAAASWPFYVLIALTIPARLVWMHLSLWLDEAWVANAVLQPSLKQMIYYPHWVQSTPVLFLFLERLGTALFGVNEIAVRIIPWVGSLAAAFVFGSVLRMLFPVPLSLSLLALFSTNYWAIKYAQQTKQYGTDLFVAAVLVWLICHLLSDVPTRSVRYAIVVLCVVFSLL